MDNETTTKPPAPMTARSKRHRRMTACVRCNKRRVKCDASAVGIPCTGCRNAKYDGCRFIQSKRMRGSSGRFINPKKAEDEPQILTPESTDSISAMPQSPTTQSDVLYTKVSHPRVALDMEKLYNSGRPPVVSDIPGREIPSVREENPQRQVNCSCDRNESRAAILREGWFKSLTDIGTQNNFTVHQSTNMLLEQAAAMIDVEYFGEAKLDTSPYAIGDWSDLLSLDGHEEPDVLLSGTSGAS